MGQFDREVQMATAVLDAFKTYDDCTRTARETGTTIVISQDPDSQIYNGISLNGSWSKSAGAHVGLQTMSMHGGFLWTAGDRAGECQVALEVIVNPDAGERRIVGTFCGNDVDRSSAWPRASS